MNAKVLFKIGVSIISGNSFVCYFLDYGRCSLYFRLISPGSTLAEDICDVASEQDTSVMNSAPPHPGTCLCVLGNLIWVDGGVVILRWSNIPPREKNKLNKIFLVT